MSAGNQERPIAGFETAVFGPEQSSRDVKLPANRYPNGFFAIVALLILAASWEFGKAAETMDSAAESMTEWEHRIWLGVQEKVLEAGEASILQERIRSLARVQGDKIVLDPERLREALSSGSEHEPDIARNQVLQWLNAIENLERRRQERFGDAISNLAFTWIDELALFPEADRSAWIRRMREWKNVEGFTAALKKGRIIFLSLLHTLSLPPLDPSLSLPEDQAKLLQLIITGDFEDENEAFVRLERMDDNQLEQERHRITQKMIKALKNLLMPEEDFDLKRAFFRLVRIQRVMNNRGLAGPMAERFAQMKDAQLKQEWERISQEMFEVERIEDLAMKFRQLSQIQITMNNRGSVGFLAGDDRNYGTYEKKIMERTAMLLLNLHAADLGVQRDEAVKTYYAGAKGAVKFWTQEFNDSYPRDPGRTEDQINYPATYGIWDIDLDRLLGNSIYQKTIRKIVSFETYAGWLRDCRDRRTSGMKALGEFAVANMDLQLRLSPRQRERALALVLISDAGEQELRERVLKDSPAAWAINRLFSINPYLREATLYDSYFKSILEGLTRGHLTPWQQRIAEELQVAEEI